MDPDDFKRTIKSLRPFAKEVYDASKTSRSAKCHAMQALAKFEATLSDTMSQFLVVANTSKGDDVHRR